MHRITAATLTTVAGMVAMAVAVAVMRNANVQQQLQQQRQVHNSNRING